jgi:magnesium-transporting ATPase (P-type)
VTVGIRISAGREPAALPAGEVLEALEVSAEEGLGEVEVRERLGEFGRNVLAKGSGEGVLKLLWRQVNDPLIYVLLASAVLALALGDVVDAGVVLAVVVLNALIGFAQEYRAGRAIEALASMVPASATVVRDGYRLSVSAEEVVPGDLVLLEPGEQVPADARLIAARNLQADESALTGESVPAEKGTEPVEEGTPVSDRTSVVHAALW